jgi:hypothetical protein
MGLELKSNSGIIFLARQVEAALLKRSRCISGWRRVRDADCDGFDVSWLRDERDRMLRALGITKLAWRWDDRTNGREVSSEAH